MERGRAGRVHLGLAARDSSLRASATNNTICPLPILLGQPLPSIPSYQLDRVVLAVFPVAASRRVERLRLASLKNNQESECLTLAQALTDLTGVDWAAFALPG